MALSRTPSLPVFLALALTAGAGALDVQVPMGPDHWHPNPAWTPQTLADEHSHTSEDAVATFRASGGGGTMIWLQSLQLGDLSKVGYVTLRYRATDIDPHLKSYFLWGDAGDESRMRSKNLLLFAEDLIVDGDWHIVTTPVQLAGLQRLALRFAAVEGAVGEVQVEWMRLTAAPPRFPIRQSLPWQSTARTARAIPLAGLRNIGLSGVQKALALSDWFDVATIEVAGTRFAVATSGEIAIATSKAEDSTAEIPVGVAAAEVHLLLGGDFAPKLLSYKNWENGDRIFRPSQFLVTTHYTDGTDFEQIPYCIDRKGYGVWRGLHVVALAANPSKTIERLTVLDGALSNRFLIAAVSVSDAPLRPDVPGRAKPVPAGRTPARRAPTLERSQDSLVARTTGGTVIFDLTRGMGISHIQNQYHEVWPVAAATAPLFRVTDGFVSWPAAAFELQQCRVARDRATLQFRSDAARAEVELGLRVLPGDEVEIGLQLRNTADEPRRLHIEAARVSISRESAADDLWYLYPRLGVISTNLERTLREAHDGYFPTQWMDAYDRGAGGGVYLMTRDTTALYRHYVLAKRGPTVTQSIEYREQNFGAGETRDFPPVYVGVHAGDWRVAWQRYRDWTRTWQRPMVPRSDWFRRVWNFRTSWLKYFKGDKWYDAETETYPTARMLAKDREQFGPVDMNHFFDWRQTERYGRWGDYGHYDQIGGLEKFRGMVAEQQEAGVRVGLYLDTYLCSKASEIGQAHGEQWAVKRANGTYMNAYSTKDDPVWNMCVWHPDWRGYLATRCAQVARETGCDGVYLDEGGTDLGCYWCWRDDHPHGVPGCRQTGFLELCRETRRRLPQDAVLYTEHAPADIVIPYLDGGYVTALGRSDVQVTPGYVHIHRLAFPDFKLLPITSGGSLSHGIWDGLRYSMFNGAAVYSLSWGHDDRAFALIRKINSVLRNHEEAFLTMDPEMFVPTLADGVLCNRFPGSSETIWTLWNGRWQQFSGDVLRVPHVTGAVYLDLWTEQQLSPRIEGDDAIIEQDLGARNIGVVCQARRR